MHVSISIVSHGCDAVGNTRVTISCDCVSACFDYRQSFPFDNPIAELFGPASGGCENLAELFDNCAAIIRNKLSASGQIEQEVLELPCMIQSPAEAVLPGHGEAKDPWDLFGLQVVENDPNGQVALLAAQWEVAASFVSWEEIERRAALAGPLDTDPAEGGVLPTMEALTTRQLRRLTLELGRDIMENDRDRLAQFGGMAQGGFPLGDPQPGDIHRRIARGDAIAISRSVGGVTSVRIVNAGTPGLMDNPDPDPCDGRAE